jgi:hypothetical protein
VRSVFVTLDCSIGEVHRLPYCSLAACVYILATLLGLEGRLVLASLASIRARRESEHTTTVLATPLRYNFLLGGLRVLLCSKELLCMQHVLIRIKAVAVSM